MRVRAVLTKWFVLVGVVMSMAATVAPASAALPDITITSGGPTDSSGALLLSPQDNPRGFQPLPAPQPGQPLFERRPDGQLPAGLDTSTAANVVVARPEALAAALEEDHLNLSRIMASWWIIEQERDHYDWDHEYPAGEKYRSLDENYLTAVRHGIRPVIQLYTSPLWAVSYTAVGKDSGCSGNYCRQAPSPANHDRWRRFAGQVARRYPLAAAIEVWNEPNLWGYWHAWGVDAEAYTNLLRQAYDGIKASNPAMRVLGGAINGNPRDQQGLYCVRLDPLQALDCQQKWNLETGRFLGEMLDHSAATAMDGLSFHTEERGAGGPPLSFFNDTFRRIEDARTSRQAPPLRLVPSETAAITINEIDQSQWVLGMYRRLSSPDAANPAPPGGTRTDAILFFESIDVNGSGWLSRDLDSHGRHIPRQVFCDMGIQLGGLPARCQPGG